MAPVATTTSTPVYNSGEFSSGLNTPNSELESIVPISVHPTAARRPYLLSVQSENTAYTDDHITASFVNRGADVTTTPNGQIVVVPTAKTYQFQTEKKVAKTGYVYSFEHTFFNG
jgi:myo-inositol-1-phosphate synthase